jgi:hypothetical protein
MKQIASNKWMVSKQNNGWPWPCTSWCREPSWAAARLRHPCTILASANKNPLNIPEFSMLRGLRSMFWADLIPGVRHIRAERVIICLIPGGKGIFGNCCAYIAESGANFQNIVKGPVHGEKYVQNCVLKNSNCFVYFSTSAYIFFVYLCIFILRLFEIFIDFY